MVEPSTVTVHTSIGAIVGRAHIDRYEFRGIPYAEAPVGPRRLAAPVRRAVFDKPFRALEWGATPQKVPLFDDTFIPEPSVPGDDILNLNVFSPRNAIPNGRLPVLFWIHGGGYRAGSAIGEWFHGEALNRRGVVLVSVSYRLGVDGFGWVDGTANNRGLRDLIMALEWVKDHISAFGGDPDRVTLAGQSAGGGAVLALTASPLAVNLFSQAWSMSGILHCFTIDGARSFAHDLASTLGVEPTVEGFSAFTDGQLQQALADQSPIGGDSLAVGPADRAMSVSPVVGDEVLPEAVSRGMRLSSQKPLVVGATADEFVAPGGAALPRIRFRELVSTWELDDSIIDSYIDGLEEHDRTTGRLCTDVLFRSAVAAVVEVRSSSPSSTWVYDFRWVPRTLGVAGHCADVPFFFDTVDSPYSQRKLGESPGELAPAMHREFVEFLRSGDPGWASTRSVDGPVRVYESPISLQNGGFRSVAGLSRVWLASASA